MRLEASLTALILCHRVFGVKAVSVTCFSSIDTLTLETGRNATFDQLKIGDKILSSTRNGTLSFSPVVFLPHGPNNRATDFVEIRTSAGNALRMTPMHLVPLCDGGLASAIDLTPGTCLFSVAGQVTVKSSKKVNISGVYTAVTMNEFLVVGGVLVSPFGRRIGANKAELDDADAEDWCASPAWSKLYEKLNQDGDIKVVGIPSIQVRHSAQCKTMLHKMLENYRDLPIGWGASGWGYRNFVDIMD